MISDISAAVLELIETAAEERKQREAYGGYEWGYHGHSVIAAREAAEKRVEWAIEAIIDKRIDEKRREAE